MLTASICIYQLYSSTHTCIYILKSCNKVYIRKGASKLMYIHILISCEVILRQGHFLHMNCAITE